MKSETPLRQRPWYKLDNAGKIFPGQNTSTWSNIFRISVTLTEKIDSSLLEKALEITVPRFPCFNVRMKTGFFWHYLEKNPNGAPPVMPDIANPCHRVRWDENRGYLFRIYYYENRISAEFYHAITDGFGASRFLMTLTAVYLRLTGKEIPNGESVYDINEKPRIEEREDSYLKYAKSDAKAKRLKKFVYHYRGEKLPKHYVNVTTGYIPVEAIKTRAKAHGATVTEYIAAVLLWIMYNIQKEEGKTEKEIGVQIPVNLRNTFASETLRNFSLCYSFNIDPKRGEYTLPEIIRLVSLYLRYINNEKELRAMMKGNIGLEKNPIMRILPLVLKDFGIGMTFKLTGEKGVSAVISNVGIIRMPAEMEQYIEKMMIMMGPGRLNGSRCAALSFKGTLAITVSNIYKDPKIQRELFTALVKEGIPVKVESNRNSIEKEAYANVILR